MWKDLSDKGIWTIGKSNFHTVAKIKNLNLGVEVTFAIHQVREFANEYLTQTVSSKILGLRLDVG